jgi:uncharacterized protein YndB with AHSA1/START domain
MILSTHRNIRSTPEILFEAFANPAHLVNWWSARGMVHKIDVFDLKEGGQWSMTSRTPDGQTYNISNQFVDVSKPNRISFLHTDPAPRFHMTMTFVPVSATTTTLTWHMQFEPNAQNEEFKPMIELANAENLNRLEIYMPKVKL